MPTSHGVTGWRNSVMCSYVTYDPDGQQITRAKTEPTMVATSVLRTVRVSEPPLRISVDDILVLAERERKCHSARGRQKAMAEAQSYTHKIDDLVQGRPHTSASQYITSLRRETMTPKSLRSEPMPSRVSSRTGDYNDYEEDDHYPINLVPSPAPICCEVIGPQTCNECLKVHRRRIDKELSEARFPSMSISHENITRATMLQRYFPTLSVEEIQMKLNRGEIARPKLPHEKFERLDQRKRSTQSAKSPRIKQNVTKVTSSLFFVNIQDLNHRITSGKVSRSLGFTYKPLARRTFRDTPGGFPAFVSPRKQKKPSEKEDNDRRSFPFDPPLLPKRNQRPEPGFFAGSNKQYTLPEKLPDKIEFVEDGTVKRSVSVLSEAASELSYLEESKTESVSENVEEKENEQTQRSKSVMSDVPASETIVEESEHAPEHAQPMPDVEEGHHLSEEILDSEDRSETKTPTPSLEDDEDDDLMDSAVFDSET